MNTTAQPRPAPWNKGKLVGQKAPLKLRDIWAIRVRLQLGKKTRDLALFNLAIDSKLRACDLVKLRVASTAKAATVGKWTAQSRHQTDRQHAANARSAPDPIPPPSFVYRFGLRGPRRLDTGDQIRLAPEGLRTCQLGSERVVEVEQLPPKASWVRSKGMVMGQSCRVSPSSGDGQPWLRVPITVTLDLPKSRC